MATQRPLKKLANTMREILTDIFFKKNPIKTLKYLFQEFEALAAN